jgi:hypothetical protein
MWTCSALPELDRKTTELPSDSAGETPACWTPSFRACSRKSSGIRRARRATSLPPNSRLSTDCDPPPEDRRLEDRTQPRAYRLWHDSKHNRRTATASCTLCAASLRKRSTHLDARVEYARQASARRRPRSTRSDHRAARDDGVVNHRPKEDVMESTLVDWAGRRRSPATLPGYHQGRPPRNKGLRYPPDPPPIEEIIAVMRAAGE